MKLPFLFCGVIGAICIPSTMLAQEEFPGLVAYYKFNGNANDQSGNGNNANPEGNFSFVPVGTGEALNLVGDGSLLYSGGGRVILPQFNAQLNSGFTVSLWVDNISIGGNPSGEEDFISFGILDQPETGIAINNDFGDGRANLEYYLDTGLGGPQHLDAVTILHSITDVSSFESSWENLVMVYQPGELSAYLNGNLLSEVNDPALDFGGFPVTEAALGSHWWDGGAASSARMSATYDDVAIYNTALTSGQVGELYTDADLPHQPVPDSRVGLGTIVAALAALLGMNTKARQSRENA